MFRNALEKTVRKRQLVSVLKTCRGTTYTQELSFNRGLEWQPIPREIAHGGRLQNIHTEAQYKIVTLRRNG